MQERARRILETLSKYGHTFTSSIMESDATYKTEETKFLFFKIKSNVSYFSDKLCNQIINYYTIFDYKRALQSYLEKNSSKTEDYFIFEVEKNIDKKGLIDAKFLHSLCGKVLTIYQKKLDTEKFDNTVKKIASFFKTNIKRQPWGDYGVVFVYVIETMPHINEKDKEWLYNAYATCDKLLNADKTSNKASDFQKE